MGGGKIKQAGPNSVGSGGRAAEHGGGESTSAPMPDCGNVSWERASDTAVVRVAGTGSLLSSRAWTPIRAGQNGAHHGGCWEPGRLAGS